MDVFKDLHGLRTALPDEFEKFRQNNSQAKSAKNQNS